MTASDLSSQEVTGQKQDRSGERWVLDTFRHGLGLKEMAPVVGRWRRCEGPVKAQFKPSEAPIEKLWRLESEIGQTSAMHVLRPEKWPRCAMRYRAH